MLGLLAIDPCHLQTTPVSDHALIVIVIQSFDISKEPDSECLGISGVVIGSALSKGLRSGPEAVRVGHFEDSKPETAHEKPLAPRVSLREISYVMYVHAHFCAF